MSLSVVYLVQRKTGRSVGVTAKWKHIFLWCVSRTCRTGIMCMVLCMTAVFATVHEDTASRGGVTEHVRGITTTTGFSCNDTSRTSGLGRSVCATKRCPASSCADAV